MGKITSYRSGLSAVFVAFFVLTGVFVPTPTGEEVQTSVLTGTQEIPAEYFESANGLSPLTIMQLFLHEKETQRIPWEKHIRKIINVIPLDSNGTEPIIALSSISFQPTRNVLTIVGTTGAETKNPIKSIDLFVNTIRQLKEFTEVIVMEVKKNPTEKTPSPLRFTLALQAEKPPLSPFTPQTASELLTLEYLRAFPQNPEKASLLQDLYDISSENSLHFARLDFLEEQRAKGDISIFGIETVLTGGVTDMLRFFEAIENAPREMSITTVDMTVNEDRGGLLLGEARVFIDAYYYTANSINDSTQVRNPNIK